MKTSFGIKNELNMEMMVRFLSKVRERPDLIKNRSGNHCSHANNFVR